MLRPIEREDARLLWPAAGDPALWRYVGDRISTLADLENYIDRALAGRYAGTDMPFLTLFEGRAVGSTRFAAIVDGPTGRRAEIGWTWLLPEARRTPANTEAKFLMLRHAFETAGLLRVEFKTDQRNAASRAALARLGAREEGTFRNHMILPDGSLRHTVWFSIIREEWPAVRAALEALLARPWPPPDSPLRTTTSG